MKWLVAVTYLAVVLACTLFARLALAQAPKQPMNADAAMESCTKHLKLISKALAKYEQEQGKLPDQLSDLYPKYISEKSVFHCPADPTDGDPARGFAHRDPKMPMSYSYEWSADESHGLPQPFGPFPKPDVGKAWGTCRLVSQRQAHFFGDRVPVVRCFHHKTEDSEAANVLSLTRSGQVYRSQGVWEDVPETFAAVLACVQRDLSRGDKTFLDNWRIGMVDHYVDARLESPACAAATKEKLDGLAAAFEKFADNNARSEERGEAKITAGVTASVGLKTAARLRLVSGDAPAALKDESRSIALRAEAGEFAPDHANAEQDAILLTRIYRANHQPELALPLMLGMNAARPKVGFFMREIAELHDELHAPAPAEQWRDRFEPSRRLVGSPAPEFQLVTPDGAKATLEELRRGKKGAIVDFFFVGCGPCRAQAPELQKVYAELRERGLQVIAVDAGDAPHVVRGYVEKFSLTHPVLMGGEAKEEPGNVFFNYHVKAYPTTYLVDESGKIVWQSVGYEGEGLAGLRKQLEKLGLKP
jgi:thiol-disulfide isomerase/thioredoxin